mmetsp:Transcript_99944/g.168709  ORF Transcript_99944/g.168709 Transcript_99944/m.168709 type:complete len:293 (+) Transcript_99944:77-955(+)
MISSHMSAPSGLLGRHSCAARARRGGVNTAWPRPPSLSPALTSPLTPHPRLQPRRRHSDTMGGPGCRPTPRLSAPSPVLQGQGRPACPLATWCWRRDRQRGRTSGRGSAAALPGSCPVPRHFNSLNNGCAAGPPPRHLHDRLHHPIYNLLQHGVGMPVCRGGGCGLGHHLVPLFVANRAAEDCTKQGGSTQSLCGLQWSPQPVHSSSSQTNHAPLRCAEHAVHHPLELPGCVDVGGASAPLLPETSSSVGNHAVGAMRDAGTVCCRSGGNRTLSYALPSKPPPPRPSAARQT